MASRLETFVHFFFCSPSTLIAGCTCDKTGAEEGNQCAHKPNGDCRCKPTVTGANCDKCRDGYWGIGKDELGCKSEFQTALHCKCLQTNDR